MITPFLLWGQIEASSEAQKSENNSQDSGDEKSDKVVKPPRIGNFSLPTSQQPGPLVGFGANIIDAGVVQLFVAGDDYVGKNRTTSDVTPSILFGITDDLSIFFNFPFTPYTSDLCNRSQGPEDFFTQLEYVFYEKSTRCYVDQATIVGNITFPTGSIHKNPAIGFGSPGIFIGATYTRMMVDWFFFVAPGAVLTTSDHGTKYGDQFLYQCMVGRNLPSPRGWIYAWMVEMDGIYLKKNRIHGHTDKNSGGNSIFITPSVWMSSKRFLIQFGAGFPVNQNLFGDQRKFDYSLWLNIGWSFY